MASSASIEAFFADNYADSRQKFIAACKKKGLKIDTYINNVNQASDIELATDVTRLGKSSAAKILVLTSGVHGAELMCGSGCQVGMLEQDRFASLAPDTAVVMIHAINPWGAANLRRNNEDNIDLCRNFVDFNDELPNNEAYETIHGALCCSEYEGPLREKADRVLNQYRNEFGEPAFASALMSGQYLHETGMAYGGRGPTWSNRTVKQILGKYAKTARQVCLVDYHSGLGRYGHGSVVCMHVGKSLQRAKEWFGEELVAPMNETGISEGRFHPALGHTTEGYMDALPNCELSSIVLEYGTHDMESNLKALLDDHWLSLHGNVNSDLGKRIRANMLKTHFPDDPQWRVAVWRRSQRVIDQAMGGLQSGQ